MKGGKELLTIKKWAKADRPREKLLQLGKESLTDAELLAVLIGSGSRNETAVDLCRRILSHSRNSLKELGKLSVSQLRAFNGIGEAKAIAIVASLELGRRRRQEEALERKRIRGSDSVFELLQPVIGELPHEEFWIVYLNNANEVIEFKQLSKGGITGTLVDIRLALRKALELGAISIILAHNHPSGNLSPSIPDRNLTHKLTTAAQSLDITVLDHLIITEKAYFSFADEGLMSN